MRVKELIKKRRFMMDKISVKLTPELMDFLQSLTISPLVNILMSIIL